MTTSTRTIDRQEPTSRVAPQRTPTVTISIPTYNRAALLGGCLDGVLAQDYPALRVVVVDNASTDATAEVVASRADDDRLTYLRNDRNVGLYPNWKRAAEANTSDYLCLLQDDDRVLPRFVSASVAALEAQPQAGFAFSLFEHIDDEGASLGIQQDADRIPAEDPIPGAEYLHRLVAGRGWEIHASGVMMRATALERVGAFDAPHSNLTHDFNLYLRLAASFDIACTREVLSQVRVHGDQFTEANFRAAEAAGNLALMTEVIDAAAYLIGSERARDPAYRKWLQERMLTLNRYRSDLTQSFVPGINMPWTDKLALAAEEIAGCVPSGADLILLDEDQLRHGMDLRGRRALPFLERDGAYFGPPGDDDAAVAELERLLRAGATHVVAAWPAFWWLDFYPGLRHALDTRFRRVLDNSRVVVWAPA
jgi:glycosyltransferase involved in cell wall biosynthesis